MDKRSLSGKVAIVTGSASGIGKAVAVKFMKRGASVVLVDLVESVYQLQSDLNQYNPGKVFAIKADVTSRTDVLQAIEMTLHQFEKIDILVNSAGFFLDNYIENMTENEWDRVIDVNLKGTFLFMQALTPELKKNRSGKIVNISSISYKGNMGQANYSAAKGGVVSLTKTAALELAPYAVNVNCIAPGPINTQLLQNMNHRFKEKLIKKIPLGRIGEPDEVAELVCFLSSNLSDFITGTVIEIDGGLSTCLNLR